MGKSSGPKNTTVTNTTLPDYAEPYYKDIMSKGQAIANQPYQAYRGGRLAGFSPDMLSAHQGVRNMAAYGTPGTDVAYDMVSQSSNFNPWTYSSDTVTPTDMVGSSNYDTLINRFMNPYMEGVVNAQKDAAIRDYDRGRADRNADYVKAGAFGGSRQAVADYLGEEGLLNRLSGIDATGRNQAWNQAHGAALDSQKYNIDAWLRGDLANQQAGLEAQRLGDQSRQYGADIGLRGAGMMSDLDRARLGMMTDANKQLASVGQDYMNMNQNQLNLMYEEFINQRDAPRQNINWLAGLMNGVPGSVNQSISNTAYQSPISSLVGSGISGYALNQMLGSGE